AATGSLLTPATGSQLSTVHALPSSIVGAVPASQVPAPLHVSLPWRTSPSAHVVPEARSTCITAKSGAHESSVHGLASSTVGASPLSQLPAPSHVSAPLQASPSAHDVPAATGSLLTPATGSQLSVVHALPSSIVGALLA